MGYHASGDGSAKLKTGVNVSELLEFLSSVIEGYIEFDIDDNEVSFWEDDTHWHEEDTYAFLNALIPYIESGVANYSGDEDCIWRYIFNSGTKTWDEYSAKISYGWEAYSDAELIEELTKRGYSVSKN